LDQVTKWAVLNENNLLEFNCQLSFEYDHIDIEDSVL